MEDFTLFMVIVGLIATFISVYLKKNTFVSSFLCWIISIFMLLTTIADKTLATDTVPPYPMLIVLAFCCFLVCISQLITVVNGKR